MEEWRVENFVILKLSDKHGATHYRLLCEVLLGYGSS